MTENLLFPDLYREPVAAPPAHTLARRTDPESSKAAAREVVESGAASSQAEAILKLLRLRPVTAQELVKLAVNYRARISNLRDAGFDIQCRSTVNHETGKKAFIYVLVEPQD
jgi:anthranilate phosphoribosyltransferase